MATTEIVKATDDKVRAVECKAITPLPLSLPLSLLFSFSFSRRFFLSFFLQMLRNGATNRERDRERETEYVYRCTLGFLIIDVTAIQEVWLALFPFLSFSLLFFFFFLFYVLTCSAGWLLRKERCSGSASLTRKGSMGLRQQLRDPARQGGRSLRGDCNDGLPVRRNPNHTAEKEHDSYGKCQFSPAHRVPRTHKTFF